MDQFTKDFDICKVNKDLGIIYGFAMVTKEAGEEHFDTQGDAIDDDGMIEATLDFALSKRTGCVMHERDEMGKVVQKGEIPFMFPLTPEIADALEITTKRHGLLIGYKPDDPDILQKAIDGTFAGFSIGGYRVVDEEVE